MPPFKKLGKRQSLFGPHVVGFMRWVGGTIAITAAAGGAALAWAGLEARLPKLRRFKIEVPARPGVQPMNILHISDLHMFEGQKFIPRFLKKVADAEQIDLVISTGDNLGDEDAAPLLVEALKPLLTKPGAFVLGSNDYYCPDMKAWTSYLDAGRTQEKAAKKGNQTPDLPWAAVVEDLRSAGWLDLSNQAKNLTLDLGDGEEADVALIGVDDPHILRDHMPQPTEEWTEGRGLRVGLSHSPYARTLKDFARLGADIVFSGHTHGGQVRLPGFGALVNNTDIPRKYSRGLHQWREAAGQSSLWLHVSAGLGTSKYAPIRFACRPEVSLIEVCPTEQGAL